MPSCVTIFEKFAATVWLPLELYQMDTMGHPTFVIGLRLENIVAFALGKMDAWGLNNYAMHWDPWDYVHITTWNFLPFVLRRVGEAPGWVDRACLWLWIAGIVALGWTLWRLCKLLGTDQYDRDEIRATAITRS